MTDGTTTLRHNDSPDRPSSWVSLSTDPSRNWPGGFSPANDDGGRAWAAGLLVETGPLTTEAYLSLARWNREAGIEDAASTENLGDSAVTDEDFALAAAAVICKSGQTSKAARQDYERASAALWRGDGVGTDLQNQDKAAAIEFIWRHRVRLYRGYRETDNKLPYARSLPGVGPGGCHSLVRSLGQDTPRSDAYLRRLAGATGEAPQAICERLAADTGHRVVTIGTLIWRAMAEGHLVAAGKRWGLAPV